MFDFDYDYIEMINNAYWAEEEEMKAGTHPSQVKERIKNCLSEKGVVYDEITFLNWITGEAKVKVSLDNKVYGIFDYMENCFV